MSDSLADIGCGLDFTQLRRLREILLDTLESADPSLRAFYVRDTQGFVHKVDPGTAPGPGKWSKSSTATCIAFLRATGRLDQPEKWDIHRLALANRIIGSNWNSADLGANNPFTTAFLLEAIADLVDPSELTQGRRKRVEKKLDKLIEEVLADPVGGVGLPKYESTAFLTYKAVSALQRWNRLDEVALQVMDWTWNHLYKESVLVASASPDADVFEVGYSVLIASTVTPRDRMTPQQRFLLRYGLEQFFGAEREDGSWPRSRPLFVYPAYGHAYCFDYELLAAMLKTENLRPFLYERLADLRGAAEGLEARKYPLEPEDSKRGPAYGWASGHHGTDPRPESWSTASAFHFAFQLNQLVAEGIRIATFNYVGASYPSPSKPSGESGLPEWFLDSKIERVGAAPLKLKSQMSDRFIKPLLKKIDLLDQGRPLPDDTPCSAIFYGPPGTSKTELAKLIAEALGWPLLALDPSHLTRQGLDQVHAETNTIFRMLQECERIVVLLDEFDELVRDREEGEIESRFLTTAMLPKLTALSKERRIVYVVATNHIERFDAAIRRLGRFDLVVPVMAPTIQAKRKKWEVLDNVLKKLEVDDEEKFDQAKAILIDLTFSEAKLLEGQVEGHEDAADILQAFVDVGQNATLRQKVAGEKSEDNADRTWKEQIAAQRDRVRLGNPG